MKKSKRLAIMLKHKELVKSGKYKVAYNLWRLLVRGRITLGFSDECHETECILENLNCVVTYDSKYYLATFYDFSRK